MVKRRHLGYKRALPGTGSKLVGGAQQPLAAMGAVHHAAVVAHYWCRARLGVLGCDPKAEKLQPASQQRAWGTMAGTRRVHGDTAAGQAPWRMPEHCSRSRPTELRR